MASKYVDMKQNDHKNWVDEVLDSMGHVGKADAPDGLLSKIEAKLYEQPIKAKRIPLRIVSLAAASIALLIFLNAMLLSKQPNMSVQKTKQDGMESVIQYYGLSDQGVNYGI